MGQGAIKASARDLRRAFGKEALAVLDSHADSLTDLINALEIHEARLRRLEAVTGLTLWARLRRWWQR